MIKRKILAMLLCAGMLAGLPACGNGGQRSGSQAAIHTPDIQINQLGYRPDDKKIAVFRGENMDNAFKVVDAKSGKTVFEGTLAAGEKNNNTCEMESAGDFSELKTPGTYKIVGEKCGESYEFTIGNDVYDEAFDAGDYGRYVVSGAKAAADVMLAYESYPEAFGDNAGIPESGNGTPDILDEARYELEYAINGIMESAEADTYRCSLSGTYPWGSNMSIANNGMLLLMMDEINGDDKYEGLAKAQMDYLFGNNANAYCFLTGFGSFSPRHTHHRPSQVLGKSMKGMLVGGADSALEDPYAKAALTGTAPAKCYVDNAQSYSCNEAAVYWNSPLIYLMAACK